MNLSKLTYTWLLLTITGTTILAQKSNSGLSVGFLQANGVVEGNFYDVRDNTGSGAALTYFNSYRLGDKWYLEPGLSLATAADDYMIQVPILFRAELDQEGSVSLLFGPRVSKLFEFELEPTLEDESTDQTSIALHMNLGLRVSLGKTFFIEGLYQYQLNDHFTGDNGTSYYGPLDFKTHYWSLNLGTYLSRSKEKAEGVSWIKPGFALAVIVRTRQEITRDFFLREEKNTQTTVNPAIGMILGFTISDKWSVQPEIYLHPTGFEYSQSIGAAAVFMAGYELTRLFTVQLGSYYDSFEYQRSSGPMVGMSYTKNRKFHADIRYGFHLWTDRASQNTKFASNMIMVGTCIYF